jgi:hypothetical protein
VTKRPVRTTDPSFHAHERRCRIGDRAYGLLRNAIPELIGDDPVARREDSRSDRRMTGCGLRDGVVLMPVGEDGTLVAESAQAADIVLRKEIEVIRAHLIDGDDDNEPWRLGPGAARHQQQA